MEDLLHVIIAMSGLFACKAGKSGSGENMTHELATARLHRLLQFIRIQRYKAKVNENPDYPKSVEARTDRLLGSIVLCIIGAATYPPAIATIIIGSAVRNHVKNNIAL